MPASSRRCAAAGCEMPFCIQNARGRFWIVSSNREGISSERLKALTMSTRSLTSPKAWIGLFSQGGFDSRVYWNDPVARLLEIGGDSVARARGIIRETDHGDGFGGREDMGDHLVLRVHLSGLLDFLDDTIPHIRCMRRRRERNNLPSMKPGCTSSGGKKCSHYRFHG